MGEIVFFLILSVFTTQCLCDVRFLLDDNEFKESYGKGGKSLSLRIDDQYKDPVTENPDYANILGKFDLSKVVNGEEVRSTRIKLFETRIRDVYENTMLYYYQNLLEFHDKIHQPNIWQPQPELTFSSDPFQLLNQGCTQTRTSTFVLLGLYTPRDLLQATDAGLREGCLERGSIPMLKCQRFTDGTHKCACNIRSQNVKWVPYTSFPFPSEGAFDPTVVIERCIPENGRVCNDDFGVSCDETTECINRVCSGKLASLTVGIGGAVVFRDEEIREVMKGYDFMTIEEATEYLFLRSNAKGILRTQCAEDLWLYATEWPQRMIKEFNNTAMYVDIFKTFDFKTDHIYPRYLRMTQYTQCSTVKSIIQDEYFLPATQFPTSLPKDEHLKLYKQRADYYDDTVRCLDEYPRMICKSKNDDRGRCHCMTSEDSGSPYFNFVEEDGFCVSELNSVCTTVRGSTNYQCKKGLECKDVLKEQNPYAYLSPFTNTIIKWCQPKGYIPGQTTTTPKPKSNFSNRFQRNPIFIQLLYHITIIIYIF